jgi:uncharacterized membrane protein
MSNLVAIAYEDVDTAKRVLDTVGDLVKQHTLAVDDAVIVEHQQNGKIKLRQPSMTGVGAANGALWGGLIGMLFLAPVLGMAVGAAAGAAGGAASDYGVDDKFMKDLGEKLEPGGAAVIVLVRESTPDKVLPEIAQYGGQVIQSSLSSDQEESLQTALDSRAAVAS